MIDTYALAPDAPATKRCPFTPAELGIIRQLADGETRAQIAKTANVAEHNLNTTVSRMFHRVDAPNVTNLVATALRNGWIR